MKKLLRRIATLLVVAVIFLLPSTSALAINSPDTASQIIWVYAYDDLLETGDQGYLVYYNIPYAALPTEPVTDSYLVILVDVDGVTQVRSVAPITYGAVPYGYNYAAAWIYFSAVDVGATGIGWNVAQKIWITGNPTLTWVPPVPPKTVADPGIDIWLPASEDTATALGTRVLYLAGRLQLAWGIDLTQIVAGGRTVLSAEGEAYFMAVIPNLSTMAPDIFAAGSIDPTTDTGITDYDTTWADQLVTDVLGTPFDLTPLADEFGVSRGLMSGFVWMLIMAAFMYPTVQYLGTKVAIVFFDFLVGFGALIAMLPWAMFLGLGVFGVLMTTFLIFYNKSSA